MAKEHPLPHPLTKCWDFLNQRGDEGWELVSSNLIGAKLSGVKSSGGRALPKTTEINSESQIRTLPGIGFL
jgi:hypothetical protein